MSTLSQKWSFEHDEEDLPGPLVNAIPSIPLATLILASSSALLMARGYQKRVKGTVQSIE